MSPTARERLDDALIAMAADGDRPVCAWGDRRHWWTSDDPEERARAARRCHGCPVFTECGEAADEEGERWHVRGGKDYRPNPRARAAKRAEQ